MLAHLLLRLIGPHRLLRRLTGRRQHLRVRSASDRRGFEQSTALLDRRPPLMWLRPHGRPRLQLDQTHSDGAAHFNDACRPSRIRPPRYCIGRQSPPHRAQRRGRSPGCVSRRVVVLSAPGAAAMSAPVADDVTVEAAAVRTAPPSSEGDLGKMRAHWCGREVVSGCDSQKCMLLSSLHGAAASQEPCAELGDCHPCCCTIAPNMYESQTDLCFIRQPV